MPELKFSSSSSAESGIKGDSTQEGGESGGSATNRGFQNNFAGIGGRVAAGDSSVMMWVAIAAVAAVGLLIWWKSR